MTYKEALQQIKENQIKRLQTLTFYELFLLVGKLGQVYGGLIMIDWGAKMYDAGQSIPFVTADPKVTSLFVIVMLAILFMTH